jgi:hypothetical protein
MRLEGARLFGRQIGFWARKARIGEKHRTEVTEVTERGSGVGGLKAFGGQIGFWGGQTRFGESIARRSRKSSLRRS